LGLTDLGIHCIITGKEVIMAIKGVKFSEEHKRALREAAAKRDKSTYTGGPKGQVAWNKGKPHSEELKKKLSDIKKAQGIKPPLRTGCKPWNTGIPLIQAREENCHFWKGGLTGNQIQRGRVENKNWKKSCLERDKYMCTVCEKREPLVVHHVKCWKKYPELRFDVENGVTLCNSCHCKVHWEIKNLTN
jgi:hypothetical protein